MIPPSYRLDLRVDGERTTPLPCMACRKRSGIIWRGAMLYCAACDAAATPVEPPTIRECVAAVEHGLLTRDAAEELALRPKGRKR